MLSIKSRDSSEGLFV